MPMVLLAQITFRIRFTFSIYRMNHYGMYRLLCSNPLFSFCTEQLRRERIAERIRALQELVPSVNKVSLPSVLLPG